MANSDPIPVMAYYYIWFDRHSWNRAKTDYPALGRYSSDDRAVMDQHIQWAKEAGIDGFIVSWKSTYQLDNRLAQLAELAAAADFKLWIIYQGLDFERNPLPVDQIAADLHYFVENFADLPPFDAMERPLVVWSGTWEFSPTEIAEVTEIFGDRLMILASERDVERYSRIAPLVEGNAYYWSSVNPYTNTQYANKLAAMADAVHAHGGLWIAPAAPGFDARLLGGSTVVERHDGDTLRLEMNTAIQAAPDAIGVISWNEFSENTHIEPSINYGSRYLEVMADIAHVPPPVIPDFDSSAPGFTTREGQRTLVIIFGLMLSVLASIAAIGWRNLRKMRVAQLAYERQPSLVKAHSVEKG